MSSCSRSGGRACFDASGSAATGTCASPLFTSAQNSSRRVTSLQARIADASSHALYVHVRRRADSPRTCASHVTTARRRPPSPLLRGVDLRPAHALPPPGLPRTPTSPPLPDWPSHLPHSRADPPHTAPPPPARAATLTCSQLRRAALGSAHALPSVHLRSSLALPRPGTAAAPRRHVCARRAPPSPHWAGACPLRAAAACGLGELRLQRSALTYCTPASRLAARRTSSCRGGLPLAWWSRASNHLAYCSPAHERFSPPFASAWVHCTALPIASGIFASVGTPTCSAAFCASSSPPARRGHTLCAIAAGGRTAYATAAGHVPARRRDSTRSRPALHSRVVQQRPQATGRRATREGGDREA